MKKFFSIVAEMLFLTFAITAAIFLIYLTKENTDANALHAAYEMAGAWMACALFAAREFAMKL